mmetsp:Transcript_9253/g.13738  ORF Transcript_9253/g.13738 Transcript_9253/m.13738 type:complete len:91 (-) Transcript_9253:3129-3401(-)
MGVARINKSPIVNIVQIPFIFVDVCVCFLCASATDCVVLFYEENMSIIRCDKILIADSARALSNDKIEAIMALYSVFALSIEMRLKVMPV